MPRDSAEAICQAFGSDSSSKVHLTSIHSATESDLLYEVLCPDRCWHGLNDKESSDVVGSELTNEEGGCNSGSGQWWCGYSQNQVGDNYPCSYGTYDQMSYTDGLTDGSSSATSTSCSNNGWSSMLSSTWVWNDYSEPIFQNWWPSEPNVGLP